MPLSSMALPARVVPSSIHLLESSSMPSRRTASFPLRRIAAATLIALGALAHTTAASAADAAPTAGPVPPAANTALARDVLSQLIALNSTHANGSTRSAQLLEQRLLDAGFAREDVQLLVPADHPTKGNVVVRLRGSGKDKPVLYIGHLDVVEAKRADWSYDPFALTERDGWLYGRGTIDMLGQDVAMFASLVRLKQEGYVPQRDIIVAFTADEEAGGDFNGVGWLLQTHRPAVDASLAINPDAGEAALKNGKRQFIAIQTSEKVFLTFGLEVTDKGGHSSQPTRANPIFRLAKDLDRLSGYQFPLHLTETTKLFFASRAQLESGQLQADMRSIIGAHPDAGALRRLSDGTETNSMLRTTCTATQIEGGHAEAALPQRAYATIQCRVIPGETQAQVEAALRKVLADPTVKVSVVTPATPSPESAPTPTIVDTMKRVTASMWPGVAVVPNMSAGASDSVYTRAAGIPTYGMDGMFDDIDDGRAHGRDERIGVRAFAEEIEFTYRLMKALSTVQ